MMREQNENMNKEVETRKKSQAEILKLKNNSTKFKNLLAGLSEFDQTEDRVSELEHRT